MVTSGGKERMATKNIRLKTGKTQVALRVKITIP